MKDKQFEYNHEDQQTFDQWKVSDSNMTGYQNLISLCKKNQFLYKFISANDAGATGSHQSGIYLPKSAWPIFLDVPGVKGKSKNQPITIHWEKENLDTQNCVKWYGEKTRREYRITRFGRGFPYLKDPYIGSLMILVKIGENEFRGQVLESDNDIEDFLARFDIPHLDKGGIRIPACKPEDVPALPADRASLFAKYLKTIGTEFPETADLAEVIRHICSIGAIPDVPDEKLVLWLDTEYELFRLIENRMYEPFIRTGNHSLEEILTFCGSVLNRRKSRAGKSLEHHLAAMFDEWKLPYSHGEITEGHSRPDFIFPGIDRYRNRDYHEKNLVFLGSKTTCKDRWRQILTEAGRIRNKHLFTLQQGISSNQLEEMARENVTLVVPQQNLISFPTPWRSRLMTLDSFIGYVRTTVTSR